MNSEQGERSPHVTILDGGMGKELRRIGAPFRQPEWSALALMESPGHVVEAHRNFIDAGAEVIIANNYAVVPYHLGDERFAAEGEALTTLAGRLAREAADTADRGIVVAGSLPPLFGSYVPEAFDAGRAPAMYDTIVQALDPFVDVWVAETLSLTVELDVIAAAVAAHGSGQRLWAGFSLPDTFDGAIALRSGDDIADIVATAARHIDLVDAVLFNCSLPEQIGPALAELRTQLDGAELDMRIGGYANAFPMVKRSGYSANTVILERRDDLTGPRYAEIVATWLDSGATIVGGCCDMYPDHIRALADAFG